MAKASDSGPLRRRCAFNEQHNLDWYHIARRFEAIVKGLVPSSYRGFRTLAVESLTSLDSREGEGSAYARECVTGLKLSSQNHFVILHEHEPPIVHHAAQSDQVVFDAVVLERHEWTNPCCA
jgi:hypothetical protein